MKSTIDSNLIIDNQLISHAQKGDEAALGELIRHHLPQVYGICLRYLQNQADAEDATQTTFIKIWRHLPKFQTDKNFAAWIATIAKNTCLDLLKQKRVIPFSSFSAESANSWQDSIMDHRPNPAQLADQSSLRGWLNTTIHKLPVHYEKVLRSYYNDGLNFREIAELTNQPIDTVKSRHRRAIKLLRQVLDQ